ncbi:MAG: hypothetical protein KHX55_03380, partial [Proteobacteria bacterium]|nr:hypothetical protein [Pseudomonadota bacterium]
SSQYPELYSAISSSFGSYLPNYSGYFLKAAATSYASNLKTAQQAGLPNLSGTFSGFWGYAPISTKTGVFSNSNIPGANKYSTKSGNLISEGVKIDFNASRSNSIYGRSSTVTPQNYSANVFIYAGRKKY